MRDCAAASPMVDNPPSAVMIVM
jgi:hypothetical protein